MRKKSREQESMSEVMLMVETIGKLGKV